MSTVDLNGIKTQLKSILDSANTTTASPVDLSNGLSTRVQRVMKIHPEMIMPQESFWPLVTCYINSKSIDPGDIASSQINAKRKCEIDVHVVGAVFNQNVTSSDEDPADEDINKLMENVEYILRSNSTLNNKVLWQFPEMVEYYSARLDMENSIRFGILKLTAKAFY